MPWHGHPHGATQWPDLLCIGENSEQPKAIELMVWLDERQELLPINEKFSFAPLIAEGELHEPVILTLDEMDGGITVLDFSKWAANFEMNPGGWGNAYWSQ